MGFKCKITFHNSNSRALDRVLKLSAKFRRFKQSNKGDKPNELVVDTDELKLRRNEFESIWETVRNWRGSSLWIDDRESDRDQLREYLRTIECNEGYRLAVLREAYCQSDAHGSGWGCRHHTVISAKLPSATYEERSNVYWYHFGRFENEGVWRLDKPAIIEAIKREAKAKHLYLCDVYDPTKISKRVDEFPDVIDVSKDKSWSIVYEQISHGNEITRKPIRIAPSYSNQSSRGISLGISLGSILKDSEETSESKQARNIPTTTFDDVGGIDDILQMVREVIELPLQQPAIFQRLGIAPHRGILLFGPPGCGKTLIAKAIAHEVKAHFILVAGPEVLSKWHGQSEENLRRVFEEARELQPSIIFFDEMDALAGRRSDLDSNRLSDKVVNQLLTLMDGVESYGRICVIASTNRPELIDEAIMRPGRFDYKIEVQKPTLQGCERIFDICLRNMPIESGFDRQGFARQLHGLSGADIAFVSREAAYNCLRRSVDVKTLIERDDQSSINLDSLIVAACDFDVALKTVLHRSSKQLDEST